MIWFGVTTTGLALRAAQRRAHQIQMEKDRLRALWMDPWGPQAVQYRESLKEEKNHDTDTGTDRKA